MRPLIPAAESFRAARTSARAVCVAHGVDGGRADDVVLVTSELIGNAVRHGAPPMSYDVEVHGQDVLVVVQDGGDQLLASGSSSPHGGESGRGLFIVSQLAQEWGWRRCIGGKQVWARV